MKFTEYQNKAVQTAIYDARYKIMYPALGLAGEVGEVLNKVKKIYRDANGELQFADVEVLTDEIGDVLWYLAVLSQDLGVSLDEVAVRNIDKLADRARRGKLSGSGDNR